MGGKQFKPYFPIVFKKISIQKCLAIGNRHSKIDVIE